MYVVLVDAHAEGHRGDDDAQRAGHPCALRLVRVRVRVRVRVTSLLGKPRQATPPPPVLGRLVTRRYT